MTEIWQDNSIWTKAASGMDEKIKSEFTIPLEYWMRTSKLLKEIRKQRRIDEWMKK